MRNVMKRIIIISVVLLFGSVLMAQTGDRGPNYPFAVRQDQNMLSDQVPAKPYATPWWLGSDNPNMAPSRPYAKAVIEKMKPNAPQRPQAGRVVVRMNPH